MTMSPNLNGACAAPILFGTYVCDGRTEVLYNKGKKFDEERFEEMLRVLEVRCAKAAGTHSSGKTLDTADHYLQLDTGFHDGTLHSSFGLSIVTTSVTGAASERAEGGCPETLNVFCGTWNVGNAPPPEVLHH